MYKAEIEFTKGQMFLYIDANIPSEEEQKLEKDGWILLSSGTVLDDGTDAFAFYKDIA